MDIDYYTHLNKDDKVPFSMEEEAKRIISLNYGTRRMLVEIVKQREASESYTKYESFRQNTQELRDLLEKGWY